MTVLHGNKKELTTDACNDESHRCNDKVKKPNINSNYRKIFLKLDLCTSFSMNHSSMKAYIITNKLHNS